MIITGNFNHDYHDNQNQNQNIAHPYLGGDSNSIILIFKVIHIVIVIYYIDPMSGRLTTEWKYI